MAAIDIARLVEKETSAINGAFALHLLHTNGHLVTDGRGLLPAPSITSPTGTLADHTSVLPGGNVMNLALSERSHPPRAWASPGYC